MKNPIFLSAVFGLILGSPCFARIMGGESGGGGNAVVCRNAQKKIVSAELLDLYEGRTAEGLTYDQTKNVSLHDRLQTAVNKLQSATDDAPKSLAGLVVAPSQAYKQDGGHRTVMQYLTDFDKIFRILPNGTGLPPLDDSDPLVIPKNCKIERLALYKEDQILLDGPIWSHLNTMNQAALIFHEAIYKYARDLTSADNSDSSRKVVATFMAKEPVKSLGDGIPENAGYCSATFPVKAKPGFMDRNFTQFYIFKNASGGYHVQFISFLGVQLYSKTSLDFPAPIVGVPTGRGKVDGSWLPLPGMQLNTTTAIPQMDAQGNISWTYAEDLRNVISTDPDENWRDEAEIHFVTTAPSDVIFAQAVCTNFSFPEIPK